jgi:hypothetical protein
VTFQEAFFAVQRIERWSVHHERIFDWQVYTANNECQWKKLLSFHENDELQQIVNLPLPTWFMLDTNASDLDACSSHNQISGLHCNIIILKAENQSRTACTRNWNFAVAACPSRVSQHLNWISHSWLNCRHFTNQSITQRSYDFIKMDLWVMLSASRFLWRAERLGEICFNLFGWPPNSPRPMMTL